MALQLDQLSGRETGKAVARDDQIPSCFHTFCFWSLAGKPETQIAFVTYSLQVSSRVMNCGVFFRYLALPPSGRIVRLGVLPGYTRLVILVAKRRDLLACVQESRARRRMMRLQSVPSESKIQSGGF